MKKRNVFLEQQLANYQEQQMLDSERIKLLEEQISLLQQASFTNQQMRMQMHVHNDAMAMASVPRTIAMNAPQQAWNNSNVDLFANPTNSNGFSNASTVST